MGGCRELGNLNVRQENSVVNSTAATYLIGIAMIVGCAVVIALVM